MRRTNLGELGLAGRLLISFLIGFTISIALTAVALYAVTHSVDWTYIFAIPVVPGFLIAGLLFGGHVGGLIGGWWINAGFYWILVFFIWQRQIRRRSRREKRMVSTITSA